MSRIAWVFYDPVSLTTEHMDLNPNAGASPSYTKNVSKKTTAGPGGAVVIFEGNDEPDAFTFSGTILTEAQFEFLHTAWEKRHVVQVTDDLGRSWNLYFTSFTPTRKISRTYPWRHEYTMEAVVVR